MKPRSLTVNRGESQSLLTNPTKGPASFCSLPLKAETELST